MPQKLLRDEFVLFQLVPVCGLESLEKEKENMLRCEEVFTRSGCVLC